MVKFPRFTESDVTPESVFQQRRSVLKALGITAASLALPHAAQADLLSWFKGHDRPAAPAGKPLKFTQPAEYQAKLALTPEDKVTGYNNFYEFGLDKADPAANAGTLKTEGWKFASTAKSPNRSRSIWMTSINTLPWKNAFIACAALRLGRWWCRG